MIKMKNNKKGISAIVATVLIILITVAAVTIIWAAIIPMIQDQIGGSTECFDASAALVVKGDNSCVNYVCSDGVYLTEATCLAAAGTWAPTSVAVQVHQGTGKFKLVDLEIIVGAAGTTDIVKVSDMVGSTLPSQNGDKVYTIDVDDLSGITAEDIDEAGVAAVVTSGNTQKTCEKSGMVTISPCL
jgi:flagellin-like protein